MTCFEVNNIDCFIAFLETAPGSNTDGRHCEADCSRLSGLLLDGLGLHLSLHGSGYRLLLPGDLLDRISTDVERMSGGEPNGLAGCRIRTVFERLGSAGFVASTTVNLGVVKFDADTDDAVEVVLTLKEKLLKESYVQNLVSSIRTAVFTSGRQALEVRLYVSDAYKLEKRKLYS